jgi:glyoxylase-like metal-dependent hydrolase (beta-lactamase superfamily II)
MILREGGAGMKVTEEIHQVGGGGFTDPEDGAAYLIRFGEEAALVDAGCGRSVEKLLGNIRKCGVEPERLRYLLITHCHFDHTGGIHRIREKTGCRVVAHEEDARFLEEGNSTVTAAKWYDSFFPPADIDVKLKGARNEIALGGRNITVIHTPGHSPGSVVCLVESEGLKVLFGQDVHGPIHESLLSNREDHRRSLRLLLSLEADILCEGHYGVFRGKEEVADFIESFL